MTEVEDKEDEKPVKTKESNEEAPDVSKEDFGNAAETDEGDWKLENKKKGALKSHSKKMKQIKSESKEKELGKTLAKKHHKKKTKKVKLVGKDEDK